MTASSAAPESLFRTPGFLRFYLGQVFSYLGYGLRLIAIPLLVYHLTGSAGAIGETYACELAPFALLGLVGGSLADRLDRRRLMMAADAVRATVLTAFAVLTAAHALRLWQLLTGIAIEATAASVFVSSQTTSIRFLFGKDRSTAAVAALFGLEQATTTVLPPLGASLFTLLGALPALMSNAATYLVSFAFIASVRTFGPTRDERRDVRGSLVRDVAEDIGEGFRWLFADPAMRSLSLVQTLFNAFGIAVGAVMIPFLKTDFGASDRTVGLVIGGFGLGAVVGAQMVDRVPKSWPLGKLLIVSCAIDGLLFLPCVFARDLRVVALFSAISCAFGTFEIAQIVGWRIRVIPEEAVGRTTSAARSIAMIGLVPGAVLGGWLADREGARVVIAIGGIGYLAAAGILACIPAIRRERR